MPITNFQLIRCHGEDRLSSLVNDAISNGYQPHGDLIEFKGGDVGYVVIQGSPDDGGGSIDAAMVNVAEDAENGIAAGDLQAALSALAARVTAIE